MNCFLYILCIMSLNSSALLVRSNLYISAYTEKHWQGGCSSKYNTTCLKLDILAIVDQLAEHRELNILPSVSLVRESEDDYFEGGKMLADILKNNPNDTEKRLDKFLMAKISNFLSSYSLRIKLLNNQKDQNSSSARKKIVKKGGLEALTAAAILMKGTLLSLAIGGMALLAGKALLTSLMALVLAAVTGLKSLASSGKETTYEIVAKPIYSSSHSHSASHEDAHGSHSNYVRYKRTIGFE